MTKRILVVDQEPNMRRLFKVQLDRAGFATHGVHHGWEALALLEEEPQFDLLITEVLMPIMTPPIDGFLLLEKLREKPECASLPVIMMGGLRSDHQPGDVPGYGPYEQMQQWLRSRGVADYLVKPFNPGEMVEKIKAVLLEA